MRSFVEIAKFAAEHPRLGMPIPAEGGYFEIPTMTGPLSIIATWLDGWDHVSVSRQDRCPTWQEMDFVKRTFFRPEETAMQLHVPEADHINHHPHCLHLWRPQVGAIPLPPKEFV